MSQIFVAKSFLSWTTCIAISIGVIVPKLAMASTTAPSEFKAPATSAPRRSPRMISLEMAADQTAVNELLSKENAALKLVAEREAVAPKLLPLLHRIDDDLRELAEVLPQAQQQIAGSQLQVLALSLAIGDKAASDQVDALSASTDPAEALHGQAHRLMAQFYVLPNALPFKHELCDKVERLDRDHRDDSLLTQMTIEMGKEEGLPEIQNRLFDLAAAMNNNAAAAFKERLIAKRAAEAQDALVANKPLAIAGTLQDGQAFSTESFKGKVVLIDFWATWCGPCVAELPRVKKVFSEYHSKGLEVVGVSNDYDVTALKGFTASQNMPWPQLFDAKAAASREWNPITAQQKIDSIPAMYLIDKKGVLRTVNARENMEELIPKLLSESAN